MAETTETSSLASTETYEQFKKVRHEAPVKADAQPKEAEKPPVKASGSPESDEKPTPEVGTKSESAGVSETPQSQAKPKRDNADDRIKQLLREREQEREDRIREVAELKKRLEQPRPAVAEAQPKAEPAKAQPQQGPEDPGKLKDFVTRRAKEDNSLTYEDIQEEWVNRRDAHRDYQRNFAENQRRHTEMIQGWMSRGRELAPDVDPGDVFGRQDDPKAGIILHDGVMTALRTTFPNWIDVLYHLHGNTGEYERIRGLQSNPHAQYFELSRISHQLANPVTSEPEKPKPQLLRPAVSKAAPPARVLNGRDPGPEPTTAEATSFQQFKQIRHRAG